MHLLHDASLLHEIVSLFNSGLIIVSFTTASVTALVPEVLL
jgi:hypothetical protein